MEALGGVEKPLPSAMTGTQSNKLIKGGLDLIVDEEDLELSRPEMRRRFLIHTR